MLDTSDTSSEDNNGVTSLETSALQTHFQDGKKVTLFTSWLSFSSKGPPMLLTNWVNLFSEVFGFRLRGQPVSWGWVRKKMREDSVCPSSSPGPRFTVWGRSDSGCLRKSGYSTPNTGKGVMPSRCPPVGLELRAPPETEVATFVDSQPNYCNCCLVSR